MPTSKTGMDVNGLEPFGSFLSYSGDPVICLTIMFLIVMGGFGFFVWEARRTFQKAKNKRAIVETFMPPAVDPDDPPINI